MANERELEEDLAAQEAVEEASEPAPTAEDGPAPEAETPPPDADGGDAEAPDAGDDDPGTAPEAQARPKAKKKAPHSPVPPERLVGAVEALLLVSGDVLTPERLRDLLGLTSVIHVREAIESLRGRWSELAVEVQEVAGGWRVTTRPEYAEYVARLQRRPATDRLSPSLLETLSIVAYRQPVPRLEVERIRGVQGSDALRNLLDRRLVKVVGRSDQPGRPLLYGTTRRFLEVFGLHSLKDLPKKSDLKSL
jgi:segregation and condensation protein B